MNIIKNFLKKYWFIVLLLILILYFIKLYNINNTKTITVYKTKIDSLYKTNTILLIHKDTLYKTKIKLKLEYNEKINNLDTISNDSITKFIRTKLRDTTNF